MVLKNLMPRINVEFPNIEDLSQIPLFGNFRLFADDTALLYSERERVKADLTSWLTRNRLRLKV
jgi:hypothetical protein